MDDDSVGQFIGITGTSPERALQYLRLTDGNIEQAIELFYASDGVDLEGVASAQTLQPPPVPPPQTRPVSIRHQYQDDDGVVHIDSDEETSDGDIPEITSHRVRQPLRAEHMTENTPARASPTAPSNQRLNDDEAMARRLQEEMYASGDLGHAIGHDGVRAPIARTRETLVGPGTYDMDDDDDVRSAVLEQVRQRQQRQRSHGKSSCMEQPTILTVSLT